jgi:Trypsin-like peptidase domain
MKRFTKLIGCTTLAIAMFFAAVPVYSDPPKQLAGKDVPQYLQDISVTIRAVSNISGGAEGSGVFKVTKDGQVWIWTCGHLIEHCRSERKNPDGKTIVEFNDAKIIKVLTEDGRKVGELNFDAEVVRYSDKEYGDDLALLRLRSKAFKPPASAQFYLDKEIPAIGTKLMHCGSLLGQLGSNSVTNGIVSQLGRVLFNNTVFDQTNAAAFPGSSGGIICLENDGRYVGMLVRGAGETFSLYIPIRRMRAWAKKVGVEFAIDDSLAVPTDEELFKKPIDDFMKPAGTVDAKMPKADVKTYQLRILKPANNLIESWFNHK